MKKVCCFLFMLILLATYMVSAAASQPEACVIQLQANMCGHPTYMKGSQAMTRCTYQAKSVHLREVYMEAICVDCLQDWVTIIDSQILEPHTYAQVYDYCEPEDHQHIYVYECSGCHHRDEVAQVCNGNHEEIIQKIPAANTETE